MKVSALWQASLSLNRVWVIGFLPRTEWIRHAVIGCLLVLLSFPAFSVEPREDEAIVLIRARNLTGLHFDISRFVFREVRTNEWFKIEKRRYNQGPLDFPKRVSAGAYYLDKISINSSYPGSISFPKPETAFGLIILEPGTVTYIGEWHLHTNRHGQLHPPRTMTLGGPGELRRDGSRDPRKGFYKEVTYNEASLRKFRDDHPELTSFPLRVSKGTGKAFQADWSNLAEHTEVERKDSVEASAK